MKRRLASSREEHSSARKRSKPSTSRGEEDEDTEEEIPVPRVARKRSADSNPHARKMSKPSTSRVEEDEESSEEMLDTLETSQLGTQDEQKAIIQSEKLNPNNEAEMGVIDKLTLINFMCHRRLDLNLSPNVNFILGRNGSGKSAIMTGIVVGLGGNARNTERGKSLKQFIRSGERSSQVLITLRNRGGDAYRHDVYGDSILVERIISNDGTGSYKIKNSSGKTISTKKEELINVLDHCNVQVDNPVSLLNQDTSRHFLQKNKPGDKYKLFMKATHLEQIATDYELAEQDQMIMRDGITRHEALLPDYLAKAKRLEEKVDTFKRLTDMESKVARLEQELQWALVIEIEEGIRPIEQDIKKEKGRIPRNSSKLEQARDELGRMESDEKIVEDDLSVAVQEASSLHSEREGVVAEKRAVERSLRELNNKIKAVHGQVKDKESEKKLLETTRDNCIAMSQRDVAGEKEERRRKLEDLQQKLERVEAAILTAENDRRQFDAEVKRSQGLERELENKVLESEDTLSKSKDHLRRLQSSHSDRLAIFGTQMKSLVDAIRNNGSRFSRFPIGPLGSLLELRDYTWATAVEQVIKKNMMYSFIVDNHRDADTLRGIIRSKYNRPGPRPEVVVSAFQNTVYDVRRNRPQCDYPTVLEMLNVRDPNVLNVLIDQFKVESILLIKSRKEAAEVMVHRQPRGAKAAYTVEGDQVLQYAHYSNKNDKFGIIRESVEAAVRDEEARLAGLRANVAGLQRDMDECRGVVERNLRCVQEANGKVKRKTGEKRNVKAAIKELENAQEEEEPEEDIATYDSEIAELEEAIQVLRDQWEELKAEHSQLEAKKLEFFRKCEKFDKKVDQVANTVGKLKAKMSDFTHKKHEAENRIKFYQDRITAIQDSVQELEIKVQQQKERVREAVCTAEEVCPRIATERSRQSIQSEVDKLKRLIDKELPQRAEQEEIEAQYLEAMEQYEDAKQTIDNQRKALTMLHKSLKFRKINYENLQGRITNRTKIFFQHFLSKRDFEGKLKFNHEKEKLEIVVRVDRHTSQSKSTKDTRALSGGERSFTTVCFVMSLWEAMGAPFRALDEFDVFMDMVNRRISMKLMLDHAADQPNRQFIFFTPQDMSAIGINIDTSKVKILKLQPPERGQTTLNVRPSDTAES